jgi:hypothetical protein
MVRPAPLFDMFGWIGNMLKVSWFGRLICAGFLVAGFAPAMAQQFSADIVMARDGAAVPAGRLWVRDGRVRIETPELPNGFFLVDGAKPSAYFVRPATHIYMDARQSSRLSRLFVAVDPNDPCRRWQAMAELAGLTGQADWRCEQAGQEEIKGRSAEMFRVTSAGSHQFVAWLDRERRFPLRIRTVDGTVIALEHIRDEAQPASLFELTPNFRKFSPEALVDRIKQSDVWVDEPGEDGSLHR